MIDSPTNGTLDFAIVLSSPDPSQSKTGKVIGKVGIWSSENSEIGFMLKRDCWGKGFMTEAMAAILPYLWKQGVQAIVADVDPGNNDSIRALKKFNFIETGRKTRTFEINGVWYDSVYFALERPKRGSFTKFRRQL